MGQKVNPVGLRLGINRTWNSRWYVDPREYAKTLHEDLLLRRSLLADRDARGAEISNIEIIRHPQRITVVVETARPGIIIGAKGSTIEKLGGRLQKLTGKSIQLKIKEVKRPDTNAQVIAQNVARQLRARSAFRRTLKMAVANAMRGGVQGIKIRVSGRLGGAEMSRTERYMDGRVPLHTLRANIDYGFAEADTTFGAIGVKVWVFNGEIYGKGTKEDAGLLVRKKSDSPNERS